MASLVAQTAFGAFHGTLTVREALSGICGSVSLATWMFLLVPQLILNYRTGSAEGISLGFLVVWLVGDVTNLLGTVWAGLIPTVIVLASYFCTADVVLISQCCYYNYLNRNKSSSSRKPSFSAPDSDEQEPLLNSTNATKRNDDSLGLPGSHQRASSIVESEQADTLTKMLQEDESLDCGAWVRNTISVLMVILVGTAGWLIAWRSGAWKPTIEGKEGTGQPIHVGAEVLGYISAVCYLGARIPQILKNYRDRSCEGLSLLFFVLSLLGNITYGVGILVHSTEKEYVITNLPWIIGSLGTIVEDGIIFLQFKIYSGAVTEDDEEE